MLATLDAYEAIVDAHLRSYRELVEEWRQAYVAVLKTSSDWEEARYREAEERFVQSMESGRQHLLNVIPEFVAEWYA